MTGKGSGGECGRGDNKGMVGLGDGGIWSGGGRLNVEFLVGLKKLLELAVKGVGCCCGEGC